MFLKNIIFSLNFKELLFTKVLKIRSTILEFTNYLLKFFNLKIIKNLPLIYIHKYGSYDEYIKIQKFHNKRKINNVWADDHTLELVSEVLLKSSENHKFNIKGICHGSRNGYEVQKLSCLLNSNNIIGTDISETALNFPNQLIWDFHDEKKEWLDQNDFIYTNSLDQLVSF